MKNNISFIRNIFFVFMILLVLQTNIKGQRKDKPNIVFILVDDLGWMDVGFMGSTFYDTPNIDRIADEGVTFTNAYTSSAVCSPTRASIMTGKYPARLGITDWLLGTNLGVDFSNITENPSGYDTLANKKLLTPQNAYWLNLEEITLAELLKEAGYVTGHVGKWHLGPETHFPEKQGFDINIGGNDYGQPPSYFDPYSSDNITMPNLPPKKEGEYLTDREADEAVNFIKENKDKPFYLNMWHYTVHTPLQAKEELIDDYITKIENDSTVKKWNDKEDNYITRFKTREPLDGQRNPVYAAMIKSLDEAVGKILNTLEETGLLDNTIIVFYSDNGGHIVSTDNSPARLGKGHAYEGGIRVPLAIRWGSRIKPGKKTDFPVASIDFIPAFCNLLGMPVPANVDGVNFLPAVYGTEKINERNLYWHYPHYWWSSKVTPYSIVLSGNWKLIYFWETESYELYNIKEDISEKNNLAEENKEKVKLLGDDLIQWLKKIGAKLPKKNPNYKL